ncbi:MAG: hypothetical protein COV72_02340, partial [Candidatus Omnitrophica bacterium CG11_big_fil_rev_8_21_14_0_20_42_13]
PKNSIELEKRLHVIGRLKYLERLGFIQKAGSITWKVDGTFLKSLRQIQISNDIIKRKANHINNISDKHLPIVRTFLRKGESIAGRVVGFGLHDENYDKRYLILEGIDGKIHYVHPTKKMILHRDSSKIKNNDIIHMEVKSYFKNGKETTYLKFNNWGKLDRIKWNKEITEADHYFITRYLKNLKALDMNLDTRTFGRQYFNMMKQRIVRFRTLGHLDKNLNVKNLIKRRE